MNVANIINSWKEITVQDKTTQELYGNYRAVHERTCHRLEAEK